MKIHISTFILLPEIITGLLEKINQLIIKAIDPNDSIDGSNKNNLIISLGKKDHEKTYLVLKKEGYQDFSTAFSRIENANGYHRWCFRACPILMSDGLQAELHL